MLKHYRYIRKRARKLLSEPLDIALEHVVPTVRTPRFTDDNPPHSFAPNHGRNLTDESGHVHEDHPWEGDLAALVRECHPDALRAVIYPEHLHGSATILRDGNAKQ